LLVHIRHIRAKWVRVAIDLALQLAWSNRIVARVIHLILRSAFWQGLLHGCDASRIEHADRHHLCSAAVHHVGVILHPILLLCLLLDAFALFLLLLQRLFILSLDLLEEGAWMGEYMI